MRSASSALACIVLLIGTVASGSLPDGEIHSGKTAMLGDSIIAMMQPQQKKLPAPFTAAENLAAGGWPTFWIKKQIQRISPDTQTVLIEGGINNYFLGEPSPVSDYADMLAMIPAGMKVIVIGMTRVDDAVVNAQHQSWKALFSNDLIAKVDAEIDAVCAEKKNCVAAVDTQRLDMTGRTLDGLHPNHAGYVAIAVSLQPLFAR